MGAGIDSIGPVISSAVQQVAPTATDPNAISGVIGGGGKGGIGAAPMPTPNLAGTDAGMGGKGGIGAALMPVTTDPNAISGAIGGGGKGGFAPVVANAAQQVAPQLGANVKGNIVAQPQPMQPGMGGVHNLLNNLGQGPNVFHSIAPQPARPIQQPSGLGGLNANQLALLKQKTASQVPNGKVAKPQPITGAAVDPSFQSLYPGVNPNAGTPVNPNTFG